MVAEDVNKKGGRPRITLVIPAFNEERYLGETIKNVRRAEKEYKKKYSNADIELLVVNNNSTDNTEQVARDHGARVVFEKKNQIAASRNAGGRAAKGEIVAFLDADNHVSSNIFILIDEAMSTGKYIGGGGKIVQETLTPIIFIFHMIFKILSTLSGIHPGILYLHKSTFDKMGGFDEKYYAGEEGFFLQNLKKLGKQEGKKLCVLKKGYVVASTRKHRMFGSTKLIWEGLKLMARPRKNILDKDKCHIWYEVDK